MRAIPVIDSTVAKTCIPLNSCNAPAKLDAGDVVAIIKRKGDCKELLSYNIFEIKNNSLCFFWDSKLYELPCGRYVAHINGSQVCGKFEFQIPCCQAVDQFKAEAINFNHDLCEEEC